MTDRDLDLITRLTAGLTDDVATELRAAFEALRRAVPVGDLTDLLETGTAEGVLRALTETMRLDPDDLKTLRNAVEAAVTAMGEVEAAELALDFRLVNPRAVRWAEQRVGRLITAVSDETRAAVRDIVAQGIRSGRAPRVQAQQIRRIVGLTRTHAAAVDRFLATQLGNDVDRRVAERLADAMRDRLLRFRAEMIARTETLRAANMGQQLAWQAAADSGLIARQQRKVWIVTPDDRLCPLCAPLEGATVQVGDSFTTSEQATGFRVRSQRGDERIEVTGTKPIPSGPITTLTPPLHPQCRCAVGLELETASVTGSASPTPVAPAEPAVLTDEQWEALRPADPRRRFQRDDQGRAVIRGEVEDALGATDDGEVLLKFADKWTNADSQTRFRTNMEKYLNGDALSSGRLREAEVVQRALRSVPDDMVREQTLWRGMKVKGKVDDVVGRYAEGAEFDLNLTSFTSDRKVANEFAKGFSGAKGDTQVIVEWLPGRKQALPIQNMAEGEFFMEREWIAAGRFRVAEAKKAAGRVLLKIEQVEGI